MSKHPSIRKGHQVAALPLRLGADGSIEILLVTSRETRRWIVPKGWRMKGLKDHRAAEIEAREEAGLRGRMLSRPVGAYSYWRRGRAAFHLTDVHVYALLARRETKRWKEKDQRERRWFDLFSAADSVHEPQLSSLIIALPSNEALRRALVGEEARERS